MIKLKDILNEIYNGGIPRFLYHSTVWPLTPSIIKKGLLPGGIEYHMYENNELGVYMSPSREFAIDMVRSADARTSNIPEEWFNDIVVLLIDTHKLNDKKFFEKDPHVDPKRKEDPQSFLYTWILPHSAIMRMETEGGNVIPMKHNYVVESVEYNQKKEDLKPEVEKLESGLKLEFSQIQYLHMYLKSNGEELFINSLHLYSGSEGKGYGSQIMDRIISFADLHGLYITLKPEPNAGHKADLLRFYKRFGFYPNKGSRGLSQYGGAFGVYWIRRPKKIS